jgi:hypothetical protein
MIPDSAISNVTLVSPAEIGAKYDEQTGRGALHATLSMPGISTDGRAIVYVSYWCGNLCGYGWFVLLAKGGENWRVVSRELLWIS